MKIENIAKKSDYAFIDATFYGKGEIHINHANPLSNPNSVERKSVLNEGFNIAEEGMIFGL